MASPKDSILHLARQAKHLASRLNHRFIEPRKFALQDFAFAQFERISPYHFDPGFYPHHFVRRPSLPTTPSPTVNRQIWSAWLGDNEMNENRKSALASIRSTNPDLPVEVVTLDSFPDLVVDGHPIHEGFQYLGPVQKSDYVRCYILHHHGGLWLDLKKTTADWEPTLQKLDADENLWVAGYPEATTRYVATESGPLGRHLLTHYTRLLGGSAYAMKAHSPFTSDWYTEQNARLTYWLEPLSRFPCTSPYEVPRDHPIGWGEIAYDITHPLSLKHSEHILLDRALTPNLFGYR